MYTEVDVDGCDEYAFKSQEPRAKSQEPRAKSQEPRAKSQEPRASFRDKRRKIRDEGIVLAQESFCRNRHCERAIAKRGNPAILRTESVEQRAEGIVLAQESSCYNRHCEQSKTAWQSKNILPFLRGDVSHRLKERFFFSSDFINYNHQSILSNILSFPIYKYYPPAFAEGVLYAKNLFQEREFL